MPKRTSMSVTTLEIEGVLICHDAQCRHAIDSLCFMTRRLFVRDKSVGVQKKHLDPRPQRARALVAVSASHPRRAAPLGSDRRKSGTPRLRRFQSDSADHDDRFAIAALDSLRTLRDRGVKDLRDMRAGLGN